MFPNRTPRRDVTAWSETKWFGCWNAEDGVGLFVHAGRYRDDLDLWWIQAVAYLPDGTLAFDRSWGGDPDEWTVSSHVCTLRGEPGGGATCTFRGAPERQPTAALAEYPGGQGASVYVTWDLDAEPIRDPWTPFAHKDESAEWAEAHTQHQYRIRGTLTVEDQTYRLDGPGWGDHSSGVRTWDGFGGHVFVNAPLPDLGLILVTVHTPDGVPASTFGAVLLEDGTTDPINEVKCPWLTSLLGAPESFDIVVTTESGRTGQWDVEVLQTLPATISELNDNANGLDWRAPGEPLFLAECIARFTSPDGVVGYGHLERSSKRSRVSRETFAVREF
jgi:hypothetical protein